MDGFRDWLRERWGRLALGGIVVLLGFGWWEGRAVSQPAGILTPAEPTQAGPETPSPWAYKHHQITALARFEIRARVLGTERYRLDRASEISPVDLALGWGPMSDSRILRSFSIQQRDRWYFWTAARMPISEAEVISHSANMHMIPGSEAVAKRLLSVKAGQIVELRGQLVRADGKDGWHWASSLTRTDTGDGSCEVVWVESVRSIDR